MPAILLVDDSAVARRAVARRLSVEGFEVREAGSAAEARAVPLNGLCCAIIDVELPDGDGPELAAELEIRSPGLPVAFFTAGASAELVARAQARAPVFAKPLLDPLIAWAVARRPQAQPPPTK